MIIHEEDTKYSTARYWLEEGWYTVADIEALLDHNKQTNENLRESIKLIKEKK